MSILIGHKKGLLVNYATVSTDNLGSVEGIFDVDIGTRFPISSLSTSDITVTNGTAIDVWSPTGDNIHWKCNISPDSGGDITVSVPSLRSNTITVTINTDWKFLTTSSTCGVYYEFRECFGDNLEVLQNSDVSRTDLSGNAHTLTLRSSPTAGSQLAAADVNTDVMCLRTTGISCVSTVSTLSTILSADFSTSIAFRSSDGQFTQAQYIYGNFDGTNYGIRLGFTTAGRLEIRYQGFVWLSTSAVLSNGATGLHVIDMHFDFTNDVLTVYDNGSSVAGSFTTGNISSTNPASYNCTANLFIGSYNINGTAYDNSTVSIRTEWFAITTLQTSGQQTSIRNYLTNRDRNVKLVGSLSDTPKLLAAHHVDINPAGTIAAITSKGHTTLTSVDGYLALVDLSTPSSPTILGSDGGHGDMIDARTAIWVSSTRLILFTSTKAYLYDVSNPASPTRIGSAVTYTGNTNGAFLYGNYVIGANTSGYIDIWTWAGDVLVHADFKDVTADIPTAYDICKVNAEHVAIVSYNPSAVNFAIYKIFNGFALLPSASWTKISTLTDADLDNSNRIRVIGTIASSHQNDGGLDVVTIDISTLASPVKLNKFSLGTYHSSGSCLYRNRYDISAVGFGLQILDITQNPIIQKAGYIQSTNFSADVRNTHEIAVFRKSGINYAVVTFQNNTDHKIGIYKISRL